VSRKLGAIHADARYLEAINRIRANTCPPDESTAASNPNYSFP